MQTITIINEDCFLVMMISICIIVITSIIMMIVLVIVSLAGVFAILIATILDANYYLLSVLLFLRPLVLLSLS